MEKLIRAALPADAEVELVRENSAARCLRSGLDSDPARPGGVQAGDRREAAACSLGGTLPIFPALAAKGIPTIVTGFALRESNVHSPNERLRVVDIDRAVAAATELYRGLAALG